MAVTVKSIKLWRKEVDNQPGELANTLGPLVAAGADLQVLMGYRYPGNESKAAIELYPVTGRKTTAAAEAAGFRAADIPCLLVEGDNKPGVAQTIAKAVSDAKINMSFIVAQAVGKRYSAIFGFENDADTRKAAAVIKKAAAGKKK
jgi:hypothetical protein